MNNHKGGAAPIQGEQLGSISGMGAIGFYAGKLYKEKTIPFPRLPCSLGSGSEATLSDVLL